MKGNFAQTKVMNAEESQLLLPFGDLSPGIAGSGRMMIEQTLARFDFLHVSLMIEALGWRRLFVEEDEEIPSTETLHSRARILLERALAEKRVDAEFMRGGLRASWRPDDVLVLTYEIEASHGDRRG